MDTPEEQFRKALEDIKDDDGRLEFSMGPDTKTTVDLSKAVPLTLGDWMDLQEKGLMDENGGTVYAGAKSAALMIHHFCQKVNPAVTVDHVRQIPAEKASRAFLFITKLLQKTERAEDLNPTNGTT